MSFRKNNDNLQASNFALKQTCFPFSVKRDYTAKRVARFSSDGDVDFCFYFWLSCRVPDYSKQPDWQSQSGIMLLAS